MSLHSEEPRLVRGGGLALHRYLRGVAAVPAVMWRQGSLLDDGQAGRVQPVSTMSGSSAPLASCMH